MGARGRDADRGMSHDRAMVTIDRLTPGAMLACTRRTCVRSSSRPGGIDALSILHSFINWDSFIEVGCVATVIGNAFEDDRVTGRGRVAMLVADGVIYEMESSIAGSTNAFFRVISWHRLA